MDGSSTHTSVVIKVPDEKQTDKIKTYEIDLENVETSKGFVIDQLFNSDEIAVYAMLETSAFDNEKAPKNLKKLSCSDFGRPAAAAETPKEYAINQLFSSDEIAVYALFETSNLDNEKSPKNLNEHLCSNFGEFRITRRRTYSKKKDEKRRLAKGALTDAKAEPAAFSELGTGHLNYGFGNDEVEKPTERTKFKSISKGVNTDIAQNQRLLEEVRKAISLNFSKLNEETFESSSFFSFCEKSSQDLREMITEKNSAALNLDGKHGEKSFPNIVMVPIIIKQDDSYNFLKDYNSKEPPNFIRSLNSKILMPVQKVSASTSTELPFLQSENNEEPEALQNKPHDDEKAEETKENEKFQECLLEAIKSLQEKFNNLLKSLESVGFTCVEKKETKDSTTAPEESKPLCKSLNKFDEIPIFSPEICVFPEPKNCSQNTIDIYAEEDLLPVASSSESLIKNLVDKKEDTNKYVIFWKEQQNCKEIIRSKSQTNVRNAEPKNFYLKKSLSVDLGRGSFGSKKLENSLLKLEGRIKKKSKSPRFDSVEVKSAINDFNFKAAAKGLSKIQKKDLEKAITEKPIPHRVPPRAGNADAGNVKDVKLAKKAGVRNKPNETVKLDTKIAFPQEKKNNPKAIIRRVSDKDSPQSKLHVNLLIKSQQSCEQKKNFPAKSLSTRLPRANLKKKDDTSVKKENKAEMKLATESKISITKHPEPEETTALETESPEFVQRTTASMVVLELFSKKPTSMENFNSDVDLQCYYSGDANAKENCGNGKSDECQNLVKSVWALKKVFFYDDGEKMEVLEASPNPPGDYLIQNNGR